MRGAGGQVALRGGAKADQRRRLDAAMGGLHDLHGAGQVAANVCEHAGAVVAAHMVDLVEEDEIGAEELVLEHLLERVVVVHRDVLRALVRQGLGIVREDAGRDGRPVHYGDDAVHGDARADRGPVERVHEGLRQGEARGLDQNVLGRVRPLEQSRQSRHEVVRDRTADAAVRQLDDVLLRAARDAAALEEGAVEAQFAELVHEHGEPASACVFQKVTNERSLARAEEARDDRAGNF
jgi:hypothetical protein